MSEKQVTSMQKEQALAPILRQAFRPMFLFGALFSVVAMVLWSMALTGRLELNTYHNVIFWHQHEMLFGFVAAIIVGFLLTAVQNWTGVRATHGNPLLILSLVWLAGRLCMLFGGALPALVVALVDVAFLPLAAVLFGRIVLSAGQRRNLFFVPVLLLLALTNLMMHAGVVLGEYQLVGYGSMSAVWLITLIMAIVSGRVLPMFTANGTGTARVAGIAWLDKLALGSLWLIFALHLLLLTRYVPPLLMTALFLLAAAANGARLLRLRGWITWRVPLLWSLHIAVAFIPTGLVLFALHYASLGVSISIAVHGLTAGAMGIMILSMMARVSLGHSGRALQPKQVMVLAFALVILAALLRVVMAWWLPGMLVTWYHWSAIAWVLAYVLYIAVYTPILTQPRADGRPG